MKSLSQLQDFFYENIYPDLELLEDKREEIFSYLKTLAFVLVVLSFIAFSILKDIVLNISDLFAFCLAIPVGIFVLVYKHKVSGFVLDYKDQIIEKLVSFVEPSLFYEKNSSITKYEYDSSFLFPAHVDRYSGDDKIEGKVDGVNIKFSELHTQKKKKTSKGQTYYEDIFRGLFFIADFNKHFVGKTVVFPDKTQRYLGFMSEFFQSFSGHGELVKLDNPEFEREFVVYTSDQIEARYILSHSLMENILKLKQIVKKDISLSFYGSKVYIALHFNMAIFEPHIYKKVANFDAIKSYFETINLIVQIVKVLNLDMKIWSKK